MICLLVMTDGRRDCIARTIPSAARQLSGPFTTRVIWDDSGDDGYHRWLVDRFPDFLVQRGAGRSGFGGAIRGAWEFLRAETVEPFIFHLEDDFTFNRPVPLARFMATLDQCPNLVQLALRRQPWNADERAAGGIVEQHPRDYADCTGPDGMWLEHRRFFTTNPSLYRRSLLDVGWPVGPESEGRFTHKLLDDPAVRFGFWGPRNSGEWVTHIGDERVGTGY